MVNETTSRFVENNCYKEVLLIRKRMKANFILAVIILILLGPLLLYPHLLVNTLDLNDINREISLHNSASGHLTIKSIFVGDMDNDTKKEFIAGGIDGKILIYESTGVDNTYNCVWTSEGILQTHVTRLAEMNDTDADGNKEFIAGTVGTTPEENNIYVFENTANDNYTIRWNSSGWGGQGIRAIFTGDADSDGKTDIVAGNANGSLFIFEYNGSDFELSWQNETAFQEISGMTMHDFDNDTKEEIVVGGIVNSMYQVLVFENIGVDLFQKTWDSGFLVQAEIFDLCFANDSDVDGDTEFVVGTNFFLYVFECTADDTYELAWFSSALTNFRCVTSGNLDDDGKPDFAGGTPLATYVFETESNNLYLPVWNSLLVPFTSSVSSICIGDDLDNDTFNELIIASSADPLNPRLFVFEYSGIDNQYSAVWAEPPGPADPFPYIIFMIIAVIIVGTVGVVVGCFLFAHWFTGRGKKRLGFLDKTIE